MTTEITNSKKSQSVLHIRVSFRLRDIITLKPVHTFVIVDWLSDLVKIKRRDDKRNKGKTEEEKTEGSFREEKKEGREDRRR